LVTGVTDALMDSLPLVIITGQMASNVIGTDVFQEADVLWVTTPNTKYNYQVDNIAVFPRDVIEDCYIAETCRTGPVVVDIPKSISEEITEKTFEKDFYLPGYQPTIKPNALQIIKLSEAIGSAKQPVSLAGAGVLVAEAQDDLREFAEKYDLPVVNTLHGLGGLHRSHRLSLGMRGMHGSYYAN